MTPRDRAGPRSGSAPQRSRLLLVAAWAGVVAVAAVLIAQRYADAVAGGLGIDLGFILDAAGIARAGGDVYDADWYTYTPLLAWLLMPLAGSGAAMQVWTAVELACGTSAIALVVVTLGERLPGWRAPLVAGVGVVTLFYSSMLSIELFLGQNQLVLIAIIALAVLLGGRSPAGSGVALAFAALFKTWPAMLLLWFLRAGQPRRVRSLLAALGTVVAFVVVMVAVSGWDGIGRLVDRTFRLSQQPLDLYSVWYFARQGVPGTDLPLPLAESPPLGLVVSFALALGVLGLVAVVLIRPGDPSLAMWNLAGATILLVPVSHPFYQLLMLPLLWVWTAILVSASRRRLEAAIVVGILVVWWFVAFRLPAPDGGWAQFASVSATIVALTASTVVAARLDGTPVGAAPSGAGSGGRSRAGVSLRPE